MASDIAYHYSPTSSSQGYKQLKIAFLLRTKITKLVFAVGNVSIDEESKQKTKLGHEFTTDPNSSGFSFSQLSFIHELTFYVL